jgi:TonB-dependent SusC/RagA subfamily outer membrane receptor
MKNIALFCALTFSFCYGARAQSYHVVEKLKNYFSTYDPERAYLQFDRPYYAAGDTIFFKAYVTEGGYHKLSGLSGVLHVDLINTENKIDQSITLWLNDGVCWGDFVLPESSPTGNYRIRAYTQWMLNLGELDFFDQPIPVGSLGNRNVSDSLMKQTRQVVGNRADVQFFPEGGTLIAGIKTKVAFKAIGANGMGMDVKGVILDKANKQVCSFESSHLGMGYFYLLPEKGNTYKAKLSFSDRTQTSIDLPKPDSSGISLSIVNDSTSAVSILIKANAAFYHANQNKEFLLVIYSGGNAMTYSSKQDAPAVALDIEKRVLKTGVSTITLFSPDGEPLCERLLFVQNNDRLKMQIHPDKTGYRKREKVNLLLDVKNSIGLPVNGHFSVAIVDESMLPLDENNEQNIETGLLLTSDLKGHIEQPSYYFNDTGEDAKRNLDVLMLTQGYRNFEWKQVLAKDPAVLAFQPEKGLEISGRITSVSNTPVSNGTVTLVPSKGGPVLSSQSDSNGVFRFSNLAFADTTHVVLSAVNSKGSNTIKITYFNAKREPPKVHDLQYALPIMEDTGMAFYLSIAKRRHGEIYNFDTARGKLLKPVTVKALEHDNQYGTQSLAGAGFADQVLHAEDIERIEAQGQLSTTLNGRLRGVSFINGAPFLQSTVQNSNFSSAASSMSGAGGSAGANPMLVILDGTEITPGSSFSIDGIPSGQVETVEVLSSASTSIYGMAGANGVLVITTKNGGRGNKNISSLGVLPITPPEFYKARAFYSPKYDVINGNSIGPDLRSTIYWNPEIKTDTDGGAMLGYYNADEVGTYKVIVEGMDDNGNIGRMVYRYRVE